MTITSLGKSAEELQKEKRRQMAKAMQEQNLLLVTTLLRGPDPKKTKQTGKGKERQGGTGKNGESLHGHKRNRIHDHKRFHD